MLALHQDNSKYYSVMSLADEITRTLTDLQPQSDMSISKDQLHGLRVRPHDDVSSSDEDIKEPEPEGYLNLSDEECDKRQKSSFLYGKLKQNRDVARSRGIRVYTEADSNPVKPKIITISNRNGDGTRRKPLSHSHKLSNYARKNPALSKSELTQTPVIKLPYVSRGGGEYKTQRRLSGEIMIKENVPLDNAELQTSNDFSLKSSGKRCDRTPSSKSDSFSNRLVLNSSGYSSSVSGNGSFSSSTSSASITASSNLVTSSDLNRTDNVNTISAVAEETGKNNSGSKNVALKSENELLKDDNDTEDVFPLTSWLESSEFNSIMEKYDSGTALDTVKDQTNVKTGLPDRVAGGDSVLTVKKNLSDLKLSQTSTQAHSRVEVGRNSICMVEKPPADKGKQRNRATTGGVKLRMSGSRSKNDAVRNSLLFAYQTRGAADTLSNVMEDSETGSGISHRLDIDNYAILPTPLKKLPDHCENKSSTASPSFMRTYTDKSYSSSVRAISRRMSERSITSRYDSESISTHSSTTESSSPSKTTASSLLSLSSPVQSLQPKRVERKPSLRNRLKGAFSFQNLRRAISSEKIEEDIKSTSHSYLNEYGEDIARIPSRGRPQSISGPSDVQPGNLYKAPSISSMFGSVRMRSKRYRERRSTIDRNSIACDPKPIPEYDYSNTRKKHLQKQTTDGDVGGPAHFRPIGRVLEMNVREGTMLIEMNKPSSGPYAFYVARRPDNGIVHISSLSDSYPDKMFAGLMKTGDEILEINEVKVNRLNLDQIYDMILENEHLVIKTKPATADAT